MAERLGVEVRYATKGVRLLQDKQGRVIGVTVQGPQGFEDLHGKAVILASGGFEANAEMRTRYLGQGWELAKVRGIPYNTGDGIRMAEGIVAEVARSMLERFGACLAKRATDPAETSTRTRGD